MTEYLCVSGGHHALVRAATPVAALWLCACMDSARFGDSPADFMDAWTAVPVAELPDVQGVVATWWG